MLEQLKRLIKHSGIYFVGLASQAAVNFLLVPVYSRYLQAEGFGQLELVSNFLQIAIFLFTIGISAAIVKVYVQDAKSDQERRTIVMTAFWLTLPLTFIGSLLVFGASSQIAGFLLGAKDFAGLFAVASVTLFFSVFNSLAFSIMRSQEISGRYTLINLVKFSLFLLFNLILLISWRAGVKGVLWSDLIVQIIVAILFIGIFVRPGALSKASRVTDQGKSKTLNKALHTLKITKFGLTDFSIFYAKKLLEFGVPMIPSTIAMFIVGLSDRYFLRFMTDLSQVGIYSLGYKIGFIIFVLIVSPFQLAWPTFSYDIAKKRADHKEIFARVLTYFILASCLASLVLSLFAKEFIYIMSTAEFAEAAKVVPWIAGSYVFLGIHFAVVQGLHIKEKTKFYPLIIFAPAVLNLILNYFMIGWWQMTGAAIATLVSFLVMAVLTFWLSQKYYPIRYEYGRLIKVFLISILAYAFVIGGVFWKFVGLVLFLLFVRFWILDYKEASKLKDFSRNLVRVLARSA